MYLQHIDAIILIPQHISRNAFYSIQMIIITAGVAYFLEYYICSILYVFIYFTSLIHWNEIRYTSIVKNIDITLIIASVLILTLKESVKFKEYRIVWFYFLPIFIGFFIMNEILLHYQILIHKNKVIKNKTDDKDKIVKFHYFSLEYTNPNTEERELAYYRSTYTHMVCIHILPFAVGMYCAIMAAMTPSNNDSNELTDSIVI